MKGLKGLFGSKDKDKAQPPADHPLQSLPLIPGSFGQFPATFNIYFSSKSQSQMQDLYIITNDDANGTPCPLYALVSRHNKIRHSLTLYAGPDPSNAAVLAGSGNEKKFRATVLFAFAPFAGLSSVDVGGEAVPGRRFERMTHGTTFGNDRQYFFTIAVQGDQHAETFEWQSENELNATAEKPCVFRLYRHSVNTGADAERGEVVAVWDEQIDPAGKAAKMGTFSFHGSGATGQLGPYWTLMAVMSLMSILEINWGLRHTSWKLQEAGVSLTGPGIGTI